MSDNRYRIVCKRFIMYTTPVYTALFGVLALVRYYQYDQFSDTVILMSMLHMFLMHVSYSLVLRLKSSLNKHDLYLMLWVMVCNNVLFFSYWIFWLENTRTLIYLLAPMPCVALFSVATFRQAIIFNSFQILAMFVSLLFTLSLSDEGITFHNVGLDSIYLFVLLVMSMWLSSIASTQARMKAERDAIVYQFRGMAAAALESDVVDESAEDLTLTSQKSAEIASSQRKSAEQLATTVEELSANAQQNAEQARSTFAALKTTERQIENSHDDISQLATSIDSVRESGEKIKTINAVIDDIAYQTNLLSLNAMIEASRSGEEGSGFKVVALEVRKLAERAADAAKDINELLEHNRQSIESGVALSHQTMESFDAIKKDIQPLATAMQSVADASHEQSYSIEHLSSITHNIESSSQSIQELADNTKDTARKLKHSSSSLSDLINQLELGKNTKP